MLKSTARHRFPMLFYNAGIPLSTSTLARGAQLTRSYLCKGEALRGLAAGFDISSATAWRCTVETISLLTARAPGMRDVLGYATPTWG